LLHFWERSIAIIVGTESAVRNSSYRCVVTLSIEMSTFSDVKFRIVVFTERTKRSRMISSIGMRLLACASCATRSI